MQKEEDLENNKIVDIDILLGGGLQNDNANQKGNNIIGNQNEIIGGGNILENLMSVFETPSSNIGQNLANNNGGLFSGNS